MELKITGTVQGVGFRPYVFSLAKRFALKGWVRNGSSGVFIRVEGEEDNVKFFCRQLLQKPPPLASIEQVEQNRIQSCNFKDFEIVQSQAQNERQALIPPDAATCPDCMHEVMDPTDRHYLYPFTNCTHCGPRFTIVEDIPYDRMKTSMRRFVPCPDCSREYDDPEDRRFHAQPVACPDCGPLLEIGGAAGEILSEIRDWREFFWEKMGQGKIFAVKGLGGFHLACILKKDVIETLRKRKARPFKPFAVMCRDLHAVGKYCIFSEEEEKILTSASAPVVLLRKRDDCFLPDNVSPGMGTLGVMLPNTPLHFMLMQGPFDIMVLTSANPTDLPILRDNEEALSRLSGIADFFILHNRDIVQRCDDSVVRVVEDQLQFHRRSRGFVPGSVGLGFKVEQTAFGSGSEMKNTFCIIRDSQAFFSQHLGEMGSVESEKFYRESLDHFLRFFNLRPQILGYDLHPGYYISSLAKTFPVEIKYAVQHHHAHFAACLAENGFMDRALGVILDGTGYGLDGAIWGFEIISGDFMEFQRECHQRYVPLVGGDSGIKWPWRMALNYLYQALGEEGLSFGKRLFGRLFDRDFSTVEKAIRSQLFSVPVSSCGRLFDAVAALLGVCYENTYEGEAAIKLGELLPKEAIFLPLNPYPYSIDKKEINFSPMFYVIIKELVEGNSAVHIAKRFHDTVIEAVITVLQEVSERTGLKTVALSGGTWHNDYLLLRTQQLLYGQKIKVLTHRRLPPNDGSVSLGQAAVAYWRWRANVPGDTYEDN